jgi:diguanylate cyclase (GGDEF)-like protein
VVLLPDTDRVGALKVAGKIRNTLAVPIVVEGEHVQVGASVGIALVPEHGDDGSLLLHRADKAMYTAKRCRQGALIYDSAQDRLSPV